MRRVILAGAAVAGLAAVGSGRLVRLLRWLDLRSGLFAPHGARLYALVAPRVLRGLYARVVDDAERIVGRGPAVIIDVGSGPGDLLRSLAERLPSATISGVEPEADMRAISARRGVSSVEGAADALPLAAGSVDLIVSTLSAHHWPDPAGALGEFARVLRPGGEARIYDLRLVAYGAEDVARFGSAAGLNPARVTRAVLDGAGVVRPFVLIRLGNG